MKKLLTLAACALFAGTMFAGDWFPVKISVPANTITSSVDIVLSPTFGDKALSIDHVTAALTSGISTGTVYFASVDHGIETAIVNSGALTLNSLYAGYPLKEVSSGSVTNNVVPYMLRTVRIRVIQANASTPATVYNAAIFTK